LPVAVAQPQNQGALFQPEERGSDLLGRFGEMERRYESARGYRGFSSLNPLIVVRREVKQSSLGKLVCVLRKAATTFGMGLQEIRIHGNPPLNHAFNFAQPIRLIYGLRKDFVKLWIKDRATILALVAFEGFALSPFPTIQRKAHGPFATRVRGHRVSCVS
jgi:hypothetical protein